MSDQQYDQSFIRILQFAEADARALHHHQCATTHILLGLLSDPSTLVYDVLSDAGLSYERVRSALKPYTESPRIEGEIPFSKHTRKLIEIAEIGSSVLQQPLDDNYLLFTLLMIGGTTASQLLADFNVDILDTLRALQDGLEEE
ncbi:hypothetical protein IQ266_07650 [filamentous cyanobacterium LEGE 11480]|uniref:Clp R domain-containing protein n=1 Tax=Romeriopsis navalis LEGE 11480 TaxID=2777977 RepID=A0A928VNE4_9CYAN|nr:Clp protease N-terminal domain-containing protein [Romeriopsis navalis]MBE9029602.1 hypothetical protein [Romeriopsis navalis LEGE 11480]